VAQALAAVAWPLGSWVTPTDVSLPGDLIVAGELQDNCS